MAAMALMQVGQGVWQLPLPIAWENGWVNCFMFPDGDFVDLIDCGMNAEESFALIRAAVVELAGPGARIRRLVVTHIHPDHYGGAGEVTERDGAELLLHRLEVPMVHPRYLEIEQLVEEVGRYLQVHGVPEAEADRMKNASRGMREWVRPAAPTLQLDGTETIGMGSRRLRVEWTPGHSPGHVCLFDLDSGLLFAGDTLLADMSPNIGLHPQSTPNPLDDYLRGLDHLMNLEPSLVVPSHGDPFTAAGQRVEALRSHHERRLDQMLEVVGGEELSAWEVAVAVWGHRESQMEMRLALQEGLAHLQFLSAAGRLEKLADTRRVVWRRAPD
jgi:glyoxylase-like metal-dependent hydrolase (beta-lactamase superfamily II)